MKKAVVASLVAALLIGLVGYWVWSGSELVQTARRLPEVLAAAKDEGVPLEPGDLIRNPPLDSNRNAAPDLLVLCSQAKLSGKDLQELNECLLERFDWTAGSASLEPALQRCKHLFELADIALAKPDCDFERNYALGPATLFPEYADIKAAIKGLTAKAWIDAHRGDVAASWSTLEKAAKMCRYPGADPTIIGLLVQCAGEAIVLARAGAMLKLHEGTPDSVAGARRVVAALGPPPDLRRAFSFEPVSARVTLDMIRRGKAGIDLFTAMDNSKLPPSPLGATPTALDAYEAWTIEHYRHIYRLLPKSTEDLRAFRDAAARLDRDVEADQRPSARLHTVLAPEIRLMADALMACENRRRLCLTGAEVFEYRTRHGAFPAAIAKGVREHMDLFTGEPFHYRPSNRPFLLYSVGRDGRDDLGRSRNDRGGSGYDDVFGRS